MNTHLEELYKHRDALTETANKIAMYQAKVEAAIQIAESTQPGTTERAAWLQSVKDKEVHQA
jgi:hypothetical protein